MRAEVLSRRPPLSGALVFCPSAGAGQALSVGFNLDQPNPVALRIDNEGELGPPRFGRPYFKDGYLTLAKGEVAVLEVYARTSRCDCRWRIVIDALVDGRQQVLPVEPARGCL